MVGCGSGVSSGTAEKELNSGCCLKLESTRFANGSEVDCERKHDIKGSAKVLNLGCHLLR